MINNYSNKTKIITRYEMNYARYKKKKINVSKRREKKR